jgi:hypothetical protein
MKKVYVLLVALIMSATMMVQAAPLKNKEVKTNLATVTFNSNAVYGKQQVHHPMHRRHHRRRRPHHPIHH